MNLRTLAREVREYPTTALFSASWIVLFAAMVVTRLAESTPPTFWRLLVLGMGDAHRFGDLTLRDLSNGEYWRLVTCNFLHYSVVHIALNLFAFYLLGTLLESWYGSWQMITIYCVTGVGGNTLSALVRSMVGSNPLVHSGGGSVVIMGLIGLCATAGWRSHSSRDRELTWQMLKALGITGALGIAFPRFIDNWGHAGGAIVGLPIGLGHRRWLASRGRPSAWGLGVVAGLLMVVCGLVQLRSDRLEGNGRIETELRKQLEVSTNAYRVLQALELWARQGGDARLLGRILESQAATYDRGPSKASYKRLRALAVLASQRELTEPETKAFRDDLAVLQTQLRNELNGQLRSFWDHRRSIKRGPS